MKWLTMAFLLVGASICIGLTVPPFSLLWCGLVLIVVAMNWVINTIFDIEKKL